MTSPLLSYDPPHMTGYELPSLGRGFLTAPIGIITF